MLCQAGAHEVSLVQPDGTVGQSPGKKMGFSFPRDPFSSCTKGLAFRTRCGACSAYRS